MQKSGKSTETFSLFFLNVLTETSCQPVSMNDMKKVNTVGGIAGAGRARTVLSLKNRLAGAAIENESTRSLPETTTWSVSVEKMEVVSTSLKLLYLTMARALAGSAKGL
jgi:hypothetical protein